MLTQLPAGTTAIATADVPSPCSADSNNRYCWSSHRGSQSLRRSVSWLARHMEQSRLRLLAEFESLRFAERASCEVMPSPGYQPRTPQAVPPSRPHRLASLWGGLAARTQSPFAQPAQQSRPFDSDTSIYAAKSSLASLPKTQTPAVQVSGNVCQLRVVHKIVFGCHVSGHFIRSMHMLCPQLLLQRFSFISHATQNCNDTAGPCS